MPSWTKDELVLGGMDMNGDELAGIAVGLERKGRVRDRLRKIDLAEDIPGLAGISRSVARDAFFELCHDISSSCLTTGRYLRRPICQARAGCAG